VLMAFEACELVYGDVLNVPRFTRSLISRSL